MASSRFGRARQLRQHFVSECLECVACQDGRRLPERLVAGGPSTSQVVIVERGQIVVDKRIGVQHLQGCT